MNKNCVNLMMFNINHTISSTTEPNSCIDRNTNTYVHRTTITRNSVGLHEV